MLAEMGIIRNGITSNNTDLTEFKRNTATVQQQMQSQISDLRDKLTDCYTDIAQMKKTKSQFEQEVHSEYQSLFEQLQFKTLEMETLKKSYAQTHTQLQEQINQLHNEVIEVRSKSDDTARQTQAANEQTAYQIAELEVSSKQVNNEVARLRSDHDHAINNVAENMNHWNDTLRDLSKEFHSFQKMLNQQKIGMQEHERRPLQQANPDARSVDGESRTYPDSSRSSYPSLTQPVVRQSQQRLWPSTNWGMKQ